MPSGAIDDGFRVLVIKQCRETFGGVRERTYRTVPIQTQPLLLASPPPKKLARKKTNKPRMMGVSCFDLKKSRSISVCLSISRIFETVLFENVVVA